MTNISTRDAFGKAITELGRENTAVAVLNADLMSATKTGDFNKNFPDRCFNLGIAEADMVDFAAGLATTGFIPFACTFAVFAAGRAFDQIRQSVCYPRTNVKIVGTHGGITVGEDGATHQAVEDIALMRALPNMTILVPADAGETEKAVAAAAAYDGPVYLRLGRSPVPVCMPDTYEFKIGRAVRLRQGKDIAILATGIMVSMALQAAEKLEAKGKSVSVYDFHTIKPIDKDAIREAAQCGRILTAEEHSIVGGFGSSVDEVICQSNLPEPVKVYNMGINDTFGSTGSADVLLQVFGLTVDKMVAHALTL